MKRTAIFFILVIFVLSCAKYVAVGEVKEGSTCLEYKEAMDWEQVAQKFGTPDITPIPEPGTDLSANARGYKNMKVIFYTKRQQVNEDGKVRFKEVIYKVEVCRKK